MDETSLGGSLEKNVTRRAQVDSPLSQVAMIIDGVLMDPHVDHMRMVIIATTMWWWHSIKSEVFKLA